MSSTSATNISEFLSISENNKNFSFLPNQEKIMIGKSNKEQENYDVITFACRDIEIAFIPEYKSYFNIFIQEFFQIVNFYHLLNFNKNLFFITDFDRPIQKIFNSLLLIVLKIK